jgi:AAA domain, putative AbiEii toxin, Type IV TA system
MRWLRRAINKLSDGVAGNSHGRGGPLAAPGDHTDLWAQEPRIFVSSIEFSDGTKLHLSRNSILVITGPNNTGKSSVLREIRARLRAGRAFGPVIKSAEFTTEGSVEAFRKLIDERSVKTPIIGLPGYVSIGGERYDPSKIEDDYKKSFVGSDASSILFSHLGAGERLALTQPTRKDDYSTQAPKEPLQWLELEDGIESKVCDEFERTFGMRLVLNRLAGQNLTLHVYRPDEFDSIPTGNTRARAKWLASLEQLHRQGDGMRSYTGTLLALSVHPKGLILLDEPEAFLHPPQARKLASLVAEGAAGAQLIVATHSDEFIRSLLDCAGDRVTVIRIDRHLNQNKITVLSSGDIQKFWADPLLRTSDLLSALFHDVAIICEGDSDARFLRAILEATEGETRDKDFRLFHLGGKDRMANIVTALRAIGVPVVAVVDIDILSDKAKFLTLFESLGGTTGQVEVDLTSILRSVGSRKGQLTGKELAVKLEGYAKAIEDQIEVPTQMRNEIGQLVKAGSNWQRIKEDGYIALVDAPTIQAYERLALASKKIGLLINSEGELEGFCRQIPRTRKSDWLAAVLQKDLSDDPELADARKFANELRNCIDIVTDQSFKP